MTSQEKFTTAQLAALDQRLAQYDQAVDQFIEQAGQLVDIDGRSAATAVLADHLANTLDEDQLASVATIALVRLARGTTGM